MDTQCRGHLGALFEAIEYYCQDYRGGKWMPASEPEGPYWFHKLEPLVAGHRPGHYPEKFTCAKAPPGQRGLDRDSMSFGWNERDVPWGTVKDKYPRPHEKMLLGDTIGSAPGADGPRADTLLTKEGQLRLDARHASAGGVGNVLFLDGHVDGISRAEAELRWPTVSLPPPRPAEETQNPLMSVAWWQWLLIAVGVAVPYGLALGGASYLRGLKAAREERQRRKQEEEDRAAQAEAEVERDKARKEYLRTVPSGPLEPVELPGAALHLGGRRFKVQATRELMIGRGGKVHVRIRNDPTVSHEHAKIRPEPRGYVLYDLYSRTGTFVGGERVTRRALADGDSIRIGDTELTFELHSE